MADQKNIDEYLEENPKFAKLLKGDYSAYGYKIINGCDVVPLDYVHKPYDNKYERAWNAKHKLEQEQLKKEKIY